MSETQHSEWSIDGDGALADALRHAARFLPATAPVSVVVDADEADPRTFALGQAALRTSAERVAPMEAAFEAVEAIRAAVVGGETGPVYGCFTTIRLPRDSSPETVLYDGLLSALAVTLDLVPGEPQRVWATKASLFSADDAWFVTVRMHDETLLSIEAMASEPEGSERSLLIELTASRQVLRAEPMRQAVVIERFGQSRRSAAWWEDLAERYLLLAAQRAGASEDRAGTRLRAVWAAAMESADGGQPVLVDA